MRTDFMLLVILFFVLLTGLMNMLHHKNFENKIEALQRQEAKP